MKFVFKSDYVMWPLFRDMIMHKFHWLKQYFQDIETKFEVDLKNLSSKYDEDLALSESDEDTKESIDEYHLGELFKVEDIFLITFRYSIITTLHTILEKSLNGLCKHMISSKHLRLKLEDLSGSGIERAKNYLSKVCIIDFPESSLEWNEIKKLNKIRNCIVHSEGKIESSFSKEKLENIIKSTNGLQLRDENEIIVDRTYIERMIEYSESFFIVFIQKSSNRSITSAFTADRAFLQRLTSFFGW